MKKTLLVVSIALFITGCASVRSNFAFTEENAKGILIAYFTALNDKQYDKAAVFQAAENDAGAISYLMKACEAKRYICLSVHAVLGAEQLSENEYTFRILFRNEAGGVYIAPGKAISEGGFPEYEYRVRRTSNGIIVIPGQDN